VADEPPLAEAEGRDEDILSEAAWSTLDHRVAIEVGVVLLACERSEEDDLSKLDGMVARMAEAEDFEDYRRADIRFHIGLAEASHSPRLVTEMTEVQGRMSDLISLIAHPDQVLTHSNSQHKDLVKLIARGDSRRAVRLVREHIEGTEHILAGLLPRPA
jgi:DNA-binding FadR family transcriptional regulator